MNDQPLVGPLPAEAPSMEVPATAENDVKVKDVTPYAKKSCPDCLGRGKVVFADRKYRPGKLDQYGKPKPTQIPITGKDWPETERLCGCAIRRFRKANRGLIGLTSEGAFTWKDGRPK